MVIPCGFKSHSSHQQADVAELADALDSGSSGFTAVQVQVLSSAPEQTEIEPDIHFCKRCCGFYLCKVRKKHKVICLVLFSYEIFIVLKWFIINLILELNDLLCQ